jgi:hypothetical protein
MSTNRKAQALTYDFFIAMGIFFVITAVALGYWSYSSIQMNELIERNRATNTLYMASQIWFKEGYPRYWNFDNVLELGMTNDNKINQTKMQTLETLGYSKFLSMLNTGAYNLKYIVYTTSNTTIFEFPSNSTVSGKNIYTIERIGILNDQPVKIRTIVWS